MQLCANHHLSQGHTCIPGNSSHPLLWMLASFSSLFSLPVSNQQASWLWLWVYYLCSLNILLSTYVPLLRRDCLLWMPYLSFRVSPNISKSSSSMPLNTLSRGFVPSMGPQGEWHRLCPLGTSLSGVRAVGKFIFHQLNVWKTGCTTLYKYCFRHKGPPQIFTE